MGKTNKKVIFVTVSLVIVLVVVSLYVSAEPRVADNEKGKPDVL